MESSLISSGARKPAQPTPIIIIINTNNIIQARNGTAVDEAQRNPCSSAQDDELTQCEPGDGKAEPESLCSGSRGLCTDHHALFRTCSADLCQKPQGRGSSTITAVEEPGVAQSTTAKPGDGQAVLGGPTQHR